MFFAEHPATKKFNAQYKASSEFLDLSNQSLTGDDMPALAEFLTQHPNITALNLDHNCVGSGLRRLTCRHINHLSIKDNALTDEQIAQFARALLLIRGPQNTLETLDLSDNQMSDDAAAAVAQFDQPLSLYLDNNQIKLDGVTALAENKKWFKVVSLIGNPLAPEAVDILTARFDGSKGFTFFDAPKDDHTPSCWSCFCW